MTNHLHEWTETTHEDGPRTWACTTCPATATGCATCSRVLETDGRVCDACVSRARNDLREIRDLYQCLPDVVASIAGLHAVRYDRSRSNTARSTDITIPGGAALVLAAGGSADKTRLGRTETAIDPVLLDAERHDPPSVRAVVLFWEDAWRQERHDPAAPSMSTTAAFAYLVDTVSWAAQHSHAWEYFRTDTTALLGRLRTVTGTSTAPVRVEVPCPDCSGQVVQDWTDAGLSDVHRCTRCLTTWPAPAHFALAVRRQHQALAETHPDELVTLDDARRLLADRFRTGLLSLWAHRDRRDEQARAAALAEGRDPGVARRRLPDPVDRPRSGPVRYRLGDLIAALTEAQARSAG